MTLSRPTKTTFPRKPRAALFDLDNTLYAYAPAHEEAMRAVCDKAKNILKIDADVFNETFAKARTTIKQRLGGTAACHSRLLFMQNTLELLGLKTQIHMALDLEQTYWRTFLSQAILFPGVKEFLAALRRAGIATCLVTDLEAQIQFRKLVYFGLHETFDFVVTSEEAGADKPSAAPFELALAKLGAAPQETIMIGEEAITDIAGAKKLGIFTVQKRHPGVEVFRDLKRGADILFDHFSEIESHFAESGWLDITAPKVAKKA